MSFRSMFVGISGMQANQKALSTIANNIANDQTVGYKMQEAVFEELFYQQFRSPVAPNDKNAGSNPMDLGNGVKVGAINTVHTQGNITYTGNKTDMAIQGDGFFILGNREGRDQLYSRAGNFTTSKGNYLTTKSGQYVLGWNIDKTTNEINTTATLEPLKVDLGSVSQPVESTSAVLTGNLDSDAKVGKVFGMQVPSWDRLGSRHDINFDFVKNAGGSYSYVAVPIDQFSGSASIEKAVFRTSAEVLSDPQFMKGNYNIDTTAGATAGTVDVTVTDPTGATVFTQNIADVNQSVDLVDGSGNPWFTIQYKSGGAPSNSTFTIGETGQMSFNATGQLIGTTGSGPNGTPMVSYTPDSTGAPVNINVDFQTITGLAADTSVEMSDTDGSGAATLTNYTITDGGRIDGYYDDGTVKQIGQVALSNFSNPSGLSRVGQGNFLPTPNSGVARVGTPNTGSRGEVKAQAIETSNVDLAKQFTDMLTTQKTFQANTKVVRTTDQIMNDVINLIR